MVDPSGGPYLHEGMELLGKTVYAFESLDENTFLIKTVDNG